MDLVSTALKALERVQPLDTDTAQGMPDLERFWQASVKLSKAWLICSCVGGVGGVSGSVVALGVGGVLVLLDDSSSLLLGFSCISSAIFFETITPPLIKVASQLALAFEGAIIIERAMIAGVSMDFFIGSSYGL